MFTMKHFFGITLATLMASTAWAAEDTPAEPDTRMPMMQQGGTGMMSPEQMQEMMENQDQQNMPMMYPRMMNMMGGGMGNRMMHPQMMQMMPHMGYGPGFGHDQAGGHHHGMHMMGGGMSNMMMNPQMMQMRMQHMQSMEQRLKNIEELLQQLVDQGKSG